MSPWNDRVVFVVHAVFRVTLSSDVACAEKGCAWSVASLQQHPCVVIYLCVCRDRIQLPRLLRYPLPPDALPDEPEDKCLSCRKTKTFSVCLILRRPAEGQKDKVELPVLRTSDFGRPLSGAGRLYSGCSRRDAFEYGLVSKMASHNRAPANQGCDPRGPAHFLKYDEVLIDQ